MSKSPKCRTFFLILEYEASRTSILPAFERYKGHITTSLSHSLMRRREKAIDTLRPYQADLTPLEVRVLCLTTKGNSEARIKSTTTTVTSIT